MPVVDQVYIYIYDEIGLKERRKVHIEYDYIICPYDANALRSLYYESELVRSCRRSNMSY
jgi:hypothetical protein